MNPERFVKVGVAAICGLAGAGIGGYALASYAVGNASSYGAADLEPAYAAERPVADGYDPTADFASAGVTSSSPLASAPLPPPMPLPKIETAQVDDADYMPEPDPVPSPESILPDEPPADVAEDAAATGDTARAALATANELD